MWQLATIEAMEGQAEAQAIAAWVKETCGVTIAQPQRVESFTHQTTHRTIEFVLWRARARRRKRDSDAAVWRKLDEVDDLPMSNPQRRAITMLKGSSKEMKK